MLWGILLGEDGKTVMLHLIYDSFGEQKKIVITVHNSSCGKVMFSQACVKNSVHRVGGGVSAPLHAGIHTLPRQTLPGQTPAPGQTPPGRHTP